jgi:hypothetical protein
MLVMGMAILVPNMSGHVQKHVEYTLAIHNVRARGGRYQSVGGCQVRTT